MYCTIIFNYIFEVPNSFKKRLIFIINTPTKWNSLLRIIFNLSKTFPPYKFHHKRIGHRKGRERAIPIRTVSTPDTIE